MSKAGILCRPTCKHAGVILEWHEIYEIQCNAKDAVALSTMQESKNKLYYSLINIDPQAKYIIIDYNYAKEYFIIELETIVLRS